MTNSEFIAAYKDVAIDCQVRYGIPASITLAQAIIESSSGNSKLATQGNNLFGMKVGGNWHGAFGYYNDDLPNEKFRHYNNTMDSFADHSRLLCNGNYSKHCGNLQAWDYKGWAFQLKAAGYATKPTYAQGLIDTIDKMGLVQYDQEALQKAKSLGVSCGYDKANVGKSYVALSAGTIHQVGAPIDSKAGTQQANVGNVKQLTPLSGNFCMPLDFTLNGVAVSSDFQEPRTKPKPHLHGGIDIATNKQKLQVSITEDHGEVVKIGKQEGGAGNYVKVKYSRENGESFNVVFMHLDDGSIKVHEGDVLNAGAEIGLTGNTGYSSGNHLHFEIRELDQNGKETGKKLDPVKYLAELQVRMGQNIPLAQQGKQGVDYLASARSGMAMADPNANLLANQTRSNDPTKWLDKLMLQNQDYDNSKDAFSAMLQHYFTNAFIALVKIVSSEQAEKLEQNQKEVLAKAESLKVPERETFHVSKEPPLPNATQLCQQNYETIIASQEQGQAMKQRL